MCTDSSLGRLKGTGTVPFAMPTNIGTARMRTRYRSLVDTATCQSSSGFDEEVSHASCLTCSNSCVVDELSRFQPCEFDYIVQLWTLGERTTGLFLVGDRWQQASFGEHRAWHSNTWKCSLKFEFHDSHPCKCPARTGTYSDTFAHRKTRQRALEKNPLASRRANTGRYQTGVAPAPRHWDHDVLSARSQRGKFSCLGGTVSKLFTASQSRW